jgi:hypothetical protein
MQALVKPIVISLIEIVKSLENKNTTKKFRLMLTKDKAMPRNCAKCNSFHWNWK